MDLFTNIDWQNLEKLLKDLKLTVDRGDLSSYKFKNEITKLLYLIETDFSVLKETLVLPKLNSSLKSDSVVKSLSEQKAERDLFNRKNKDILGFLRQNDYQYWLLIFLLINNNKIRKEHLTLFEIIDHFIERVKNDSFSWQDIEYTGSGATRCKTNLRFAFDDLKTLGLVNLYDKDHKESWTLTYVGFFTAASFCFEPLDREETPLTRKITKFHQSTYYNRLNRLILQRTHELSEGYCFYSLIDKLAIDNLGLEQQKNGSIIFKEYYHFIDHIFSKKEKGRRNRLSSFLSELDKEYNLSAYMEELSIKFDAEVFFNQLKGSIRF